MKKLLIIFMFLLAITSLSGQENAEQKLSAAIYEEEVNGDLEKAITDYKFIVENYAENRPVAAKAQLRIGICYEKLGKKQATEAYKKVLELYADQQKTAETARARLENLNSDTVSKKNKPANPTFKQIILDRDIWFNQGGPTNYCISPDGENLVFPSNREDNKSGSALYITSLSGPPSRRLLTSSDFLIENHPGYSPDGKSIRFVGRKEGETFWDSNGYQVKATGGKPTFYSSLKFVVVNNQYIIQKKDLRDTLSVIRSLSGDSVSAFIFPPEIYPVIPINGISPDLKWISYTARLKDASRNAGDCWLVSFFGNKHIRLTNWKGFDGHGAWLGKNDTYYFVSDRNGNRNIYRLKIDPKTGGKGGKAEQVTFYKDADVYIPYFLEKNNAIIFCLRKNISEVVIPESENSKRFKTIATGKDPILSPDGNTVYFVGTGDNEGIFSIPRSGGIKNRLTKYLPCGGYEEEHSFALSPDGRTITFFVKNEAGEVDLYFLSTDGKKLHKSVTLKVARVEQRDPSLGITSTWSPDNQKVAFCINDTIYTVPVWGNKIEKLAEVKGWEVYSTEWSPNGKYVAGFTWDDDKKMIDVVIVSTETGEVRKLTTDKEHEWKENLKWHPDGDKLTYFFYYLGEDGKNTEPDDADQVRIAFVDGRPTKEFLDQPDSWDFWGNWHPNGVDYYFWGDSKSGEMYSWGLYKYNTDTKKFSFVLDNTDHRLPNFSKDGKHMVFTKRVIENQLWMMEGVED